MEYKLKMDAQRRLDKLADDVVGAINLLERNVIDHEAHGYTGEQRVRDELVNALIRAGYSFDFDEDEPEVGDE